MRKLNNEDKAGLYCTVIIHLVVLIILMVWQIGTSWKRENSFLLDFSKEEAYEKEQRELQKMLEDEAYDEEIARRLEELLSGTSGTSFKNVAVDRAALKDDRGTDAEKLYEDAEKLAAELKNGIAPDEPDDDYANLAPAKKEEKPQREETYSGPSVVSYNLDGRKASKLPIPAYRCYGGGMVTVIITVDNAGNVISAKVQDEVSTDDKCLREFAVRAARMSKFSSSPTAPPRQGGDIVYQFIAQ